MKNQARHSIRYETDSGIKSSSARSLRSKRVENQEKDEKDENEQMEEFVVNTIKSAKTVTKGKPGINKLNLLKEYAKSQVTVTSQTSKSQLKKDKKDEDEEIQSKYSESAKEADIEDLVVVKCPPDFERVWNLIEKMRSETIAPVDEVGAENCGDPNAPKDVYNYQTLVGLLLSSQTKDPVTYATMTKLRNHGLTIENIRKTSSEDIKEMIYGVSFHNNKTKFLKELTDMLYDDFDSKVPSELKQLLKLPGIGPKMGHLYLQICCDKVEGIAVDVHVHRIANRLKWVKTKTPEETRKSLEKWLHKDKWAKVNDLLVGLGQTICYARAPKCHECLLNNICDVGRENMRKYKENGNQSKKKSTSKSKATPKTPKTPSLANTEIDDKVQSKSKIKSDEGLFISDLIDLSSDMKYKPNKENSEVESDTGKENGKVKNLVSSKHSLKEKAFKSKAKILGKEEKTPLDLKIRKK